MKKKTTVNSQKSENANFTIICFDEICFFIYNKYMSYTELSNQFKIGEDVFYPSVGLCSILKKEERNGKNYLKLSSLNTDSIVLLPAENALNLGLRHLTGKDELISSLKTLSLPVEDEEKEWKHRVEKNTMRLKEGTPSAICRVISSLYRRSKIRELPSIEKKLYDTALVMLVDETVCVLKKSEEDVRKLIFSYLENCAEL